MDVDPAKDYISLVFEMGRMGHTSRIVTIVDGIQVIEVTTHDQDGDPVETSYRVHGEKYDSLKAAIKAARGEVEGGPG